MFTIEKHLEDLTRHITLVRNNCVLLGERLIAQGRLDFGRLLIAKGHIHDHSKFFGIEWKYLHVGPDVPSAQLTAAIQQHVHTNSHHPEYWGGFANMPEIAVAEMVCDWFSRSQEFGTSLREWIRTSAIEKHNIQPELLQTKWLNNFLDILLENSFKEGT